MAWRRTTTSTTPARRRTSSFAACRCSLCEEQVHAIPLMKQWTKPADNYTEITTHDNVVIPTSESRAFLAEIGIGGEVLHTPGIPTTA